MIRSLLFAVILWLASAACTSTLSPELKRELEAQLSAKHAPIAGCYQSALKKREQISGKVMVRFEVAATSKAPTSVEVLSSDFKDGTFTKCIVNETQDVRLTEAPEVPIAVTYPIELVSLAAPSSSPAE